MNFIKCEINFIKCDYLGHIEKRSSVLHILWGKIQFTFNYQSRNANDKFEKTEWKVPNGLARSRSSVHGRSLHFHLCLLCQWGDWQDRISSFTWQAGWLQEGVPAVVTKTRSSTASGELQSQSRKGTWCLELAWMRTIIHSRASMTLQPGSFHPMGGALRSLEFAGEDWRLKWVWGGRRCDWLLHVGWCGYELLVALIIKARQNNGYAWIKEI